MGVILLYPIKKLLQFLMRFRSVKTIAEIILREDMMTDRYDELLKTVSLEEKIPFSVLKAFIEVTTDSNPFFVETKKHLWIDIVSQYRTKFETLYLVHTVNTKLNFIKPTETELTALYCTYYGIMRVPYFKLVFEFNYAKQPFGLVTDVSENLKQGIALLKKYKAFFPHVPDDMAWGLAAVSYFSDPMKIMKVVDRVKKTNLQDSLKHIAPYVKAVRKNFGKTADYYEDIFSRTVALSKKYKKQEIAFLMAE